MTFYLHYLFCIIVWFDEDSRAGANHKNNHNFLEELREDLNREKTFSFGHCPNDGGGEGGLPMPEFFGPLFISAFLVNKKSLFLHKCQCIELLTVFRLHIYSLLYSTYSILSSKLTFKS